MTQAFAELNFPAALLRAAYSKRNKWFDVDHVHHQHRQIARLEFVPQELAEGQEDSYLPNGIKYLVGIWMGHFASGENAM